MTVLNECFRRAKELTLAKWQEVLRLTRLKKHDRAWSVSVEPCGFCTLDDMLGKFFTGIFSGWCNYCPATDLCTSKIIAKVARGISELWDDTTHDAAPVIKDLETLLVEIAAIQEFKTK